MSISLKPLPRKRKDRDTKLNRMPKKGELWGATTGKKYHVIDIIPDFVYPANKVLILSELHHGTRKAIDLEEFLGVISLYGNKVQRFRKILA